MSNLYREYLKSKVGIASSRVYDLDRAIDTLHDAICKLDNENAELVKKHGLCNLIKMFCTLEEYRDITPILFDGRDGVY